MANPAVVDYAFGSAIRIAYGDRDGGDEDGRDGVRSAVKSGSYCAAKTTPPTKTFVLRVLQQHSLRPAIPVQRKQIDHECRSRSGSGSHDRLKQLSPG